MLQKRALILFAASLLLLAGIVACSGVAGNASFNTTPVATVQLDRPTITPDSQESSLQTRGPPTNNAMATRRGATRTPSATVNGFQTIAYNDLPPEARETLALIESEGPFPYRQDGQIFQNREGLLPKEPNGYYHEYTVDTPGSDDRGARRIITGSEGELYYTADHYNSFKVIVNNE